IERPQMTAAAGLYNVVRQVFGSIGISLAAAELARGTGKYHAVLAEHVTYTNPAAVSWIARVTAAMQAKGADAATAGRQALRMLDGQMVRQAAVLAYNHIFVLIAMLFVISVPLVLLLSAGGGEVSHEMVGE
ncbi:MAG TPA: hypothetical protein VFZ20_23815, partial [Longimicrobium sp.]